MSETQPSSPLPQGAEPHGDAREYREVVLVKHGQRFVFRYAPGEEGKLLAGLADMARDPKSDLSWFDAALLSHQMGVSMGHQLDRFRKV